MRPFRFGVNITSLTSRAAFADTCRRVERLGYDVLMVADHLGIPDPFPLLATAAELTTRPRLGTFVLNAAFWNPVVLARTVATLDLLSEGRIELGLGTGYVQAEFDRAGLPWGTARERVDRLEHTITELVAALSDEEHRPASVQRPHPPLLIGGNGNRVLRIAAQHAAIVGFTGAAADESAPTGLRPISADGIAERVAYFEKQAGARVAEIESNLLIQQVVITDDRRAHVEQLLPYFPGFDVDQVLDLPIFMFGTVDEIAEQARTIRERFGCSYLTVLEPYLDAFAPVMERLRS